MLVAVRKAVIAGAELSAAMAATRLFKSGYLDLISEVVLVLAVAG